MLGGVSRIERGHALFNHIAFLRRTNSSVFRIEDAELEPSTRLSALPQVAFGSLECHLALPFHIRVPPTLRHLSSDFVQETAFWRDKRVTCDSTTLALDFTQTLSG
jgi:hypothetical protein